MQLKFNLELKISNQIKFFFFLKQKELIYFKLNEFNLIKFVKIKQIILLEKQIFR